MIDIFDIANHSMNAVHYPHKIIVIDGQIFGVFKFV